ncbi:NUMOD4 motif-containing HNH endonuclease [Rhodococcus erythropolis]|uniref:NUMOD4 motif-containing HNH endonuclease n=1 Tax=Rhodococcus erythropolis TaxID=1833 RepID=UPI001CD97B98
MNATPVEIWRPIPGYEGSYEVSNHGRVRSLDHTVVRRNGVNYRHKGGLRSTTPNRTGHLYVILRNCGANDRRPVHRLVLEAFTGPSGGMFACHIDGNPNNNRIENLKWATPQENSEDSLRHGTHYNAFKTHCKRDHLLAGANLRIERNGARRCKACERITRNRRRISSVV